MNTQFFFSLERSFTHQLNDIEMNHELNTYNGLSHFSNEKERRMNTEGSNLAIDLNKHSLAQLGLASTV